MYKIEFFFGGLLLGTALGSYLFDILITRPMNLMTMQKHSEERTASFELGRRQGIELAIEKLGQKDAGKKL